MPTGHGTESSTDELRPIARGSEGDQLAFSFSGLTGPAKSHDWLSAAESFQLFNNALLGQPASLPLAPIDGPADVFCRGEQAAQLDPVCRAVENGTEMLTDFFARTVVFQIRSGLGRAVFRRPTTSQPSRE
jgi:hypothetical protein